MEEPQTGPKPNAEWELVKELVYQWETDQPRDLNGWLTGNCPSASVRQEVERLVRASATAGDFMRSKATEEHFGVPSKTPVKIGRYRVIAELGSGGSGIVYAAYDQSLGRKVAIKVLADPSAGAERRKRLRLDAKAATAAHHPNIVTIFDIGDDDGLEYIVMECVEGESLSKMLGPGGLPVQTVLKLALQIVEAVGVAHKAGIIHRDLKPNNIMITPDGVVKILDFGLAKYVDPDAGLSSMPATIEGHFAGTVAYVSPEQAEGKPVDSRGDIFSFGCVLFEMLSGKPAFRGQTPVSILGSILHQPAPRLRQAVPQIDDRFDAMVERCLRKKPEDRFSTMEEVGTSLSELVETGVSPSRFSYRTRHLLIRAGMAAGIVALAATATYLVATRRASPAFVQFDQLLVTTGSDLASFPAISPDGKFIAYASDAAGRRNLDIWVQQTELRDAKPIATNAANEYSPSFSPKGSEIIYRSEQDGGGLYKVSVLGGPPLLLAEHGRDGRFSPDGKWVAYWTGEIGASLRSGTARIFVMRTTGGPPQEFPPGFDVAAYPVWSANENKMIFLGRKTGETQGDWWVADLQSKAVRPTGMLQKIQHVKTMFPLNAYFPVPSVWLPDGTVLFSARNRDSTNIWAVDVRPDGTSKQDPHHWTDGTDIEAYPSATVTADGSTHTVYAALSESSAIWKIPLTSAGVASGPAQPLISGLFRIGASSISADGSRVAFSAKQPQGLTIHIADFQGERQTSISAVKVGDTNRPVLSGDGGTVAWLDAFNHKGYIMGVKGDSEQEICAGCGQPTQISFDGRKVIFESGKDFLPGVSETDELILCARYQKPRTLFHITDGPQWRQAGGRFSPDERWLAFSGWNDQNSSPQILVVPVTPDGNLLATQVVKISAAGGSSLEPVWSPKGDRIYFLSNRDGNQCVWARNVDPGSKLPVGEEFDVAHFHKVGRVIRGPAPDSGAIGLAAAKDFLILTLTDRKGNIWSRSTK